MIIRLFRAKPKAGSVDELVKIAREVSIPFVDGHPGLVARYAGKGLGDTGDELVMISVWESLEAMKGMTGEHWETEVLPDARLSQLIAESSVRHYEPLE